MNIFIYNLNGSTTAHVQAKAKAQIDVTNKHQASVRLETQTRMIRHQLYYVKHSFPVINLFTYSFTRQFTTK